MVGLSARSEGSEPCSIPYFVSGNTAMDEGGRRREDVDDKGKGSSNEYIAGGRCRKINIASTIDEKLLDRESSPNICIYFTILAINLATSDVLMVLCWHGLHWNMDFINEFNVIGVRRDISNEHHCKLNTPSPPRGATDRSNRYIINHI